MKTIISFCLLVCASVLQGALFGMASLFPSKCIQALQAGMVGHSVLKPSLQAIVVSTIYLFDRYVNYICMYYIYIYYIHIFYSSIFFIILFYQCPYPSLLYFLACNSDAETSPLLSRNTMTENIKTDIYNKDCNIYKVVGIILKFV